MGRKMFFFTVIILFLVFPSHANAEMIHTMSTDPLPFDTVTVDSHIDTMMLVVDEDTWLPSIDIGENTSLEFDISKAKTGGIDVAFLAAFTSGFHDNNPRSISRTLALLNALYWTEARNEDAMQIAKNIAEINRIVDDGKLAVVPTIEGAYSLEERNAIELLHQYHDLGVKVIGFTWNYSNALGEGADRVHGDPAKTPSDGGLTELGSQVVKEMNRLGMVIDVSHMARSTLRDVLEISEAPILATHSGVFALKEHQRNLTDEEMLALKENGGVLSIVFYPAFLTDDSAAYVSDIVDHIDYAVELMGIDHVGLGSDFDGATLPEDLQSAAEFEQITAELLSRGYSLEAIEKILGGNTLRVLEEAEKLAVEKGRAEGEIHIVPELEMGEKVDTETPYLRANLESRNGEELKIEKLRMIVDGIAYEPDFDDDTLTMHLSLEDPLQEKFHIVTFEATDKNDNRTRETLIFYIE